MFKLALSPVFWMKVKTEFTGADGKDDRRTEHSFEVLVKRYSVDQVNEMQDRVRDLKLDDRAICLEVVTDWRGVLDETGNPLPFEMFDQALNVVGVAPSIVRAWFDSYPKAKLKN